jgi:hypothetical protein
MRAAGAAEADLQERRVDVDPRRHRDRAGRPGAPGVVQAEASEPVGCCPRAPKGHIQPERPGPLSLQICAQIHRSHRSTPGDSGAASLITSEGLAQ